MQLPQFIQRALDFFSKAEANFVSKDSLDKAQSSVAELGGKVKDLEKEKADLAQRVEALSKDNEALQGKVNDLEGKATAAEHKANDVLAQQGVPLDLVPKAESGNGAVAGENAWAKYNRLLSENPKAAGEFYATHAQAILESRK